MTKEQELKKVFDANGGYITASDARKMDISSFFITKFVRDNKLIRIDRGFYASEQWPIDGYLVFQSRYPQYVFSFYSALALNKLTDKIISWKEVTAPNGYHPFKTKRDDVVAHIERNKDVYALGITTATTIYGNEVRCYDAERTVCDIIKNRSKIDGETFVKAIHFYNEKKEKDDSLLMKYASALGIEKEVYEIIEVIKKP